MFQGVHAIFCVTNFWEHLDLGADNAGAKEAKQAFNVALAASKITTLQHYIFSTLPSATQLSGGKHAVPHMDHKSNVDDRIRTELPDLAAKTTFVWLGWYSANMVFFPAIRPFELPLSGGKWIWMQPSSPDALLPVSGDVGNNLGVFVVAALRNPVKSHGKYIFVRTDLISFRGILKVWAEVSGKECEYVACSLQEYEAIWGPVGREMGLQYCSGEVWDDWPTLKPGEFCTAEEIGVRKDNLLDLRAHLSGLKDKLLGA